MEVKREPVQALGRSSVVEEEALQEPEPEPSNPIGTLEEVGGRGSRGGPGRSEGRWRGAKAVHDRGAADTGPGQRSGRGRPEPTEEPHEEVPREARYQVCPKISAVISTPWQADPVSPLPHPSRAQPGGGVHESLHEQAGHPGLCGAAEVPLQGRRQRGRRVRHHSGGPPPSTSPPRGEGLLTRLLRLSTPSLVKISFDVGSMLGALVRKTKLRGLLFFSLHVFGDELIEMIKEYKIEAVWCNGLRSLEKTLDGIQQRARSL